MPEGRWPEGATPCPRQGAAAMRSNPTSKEQWLCGRRRAYRSHPTLKVRKGSSEEIPLIQRRAAVRRYLSSKVRSSSCPLLEQP